MSRIDTQLVNPAKKFFSWNGDEEGGFVEYYDKEAKAKVKVDMPFGFMVLDRVFQIGGGRDVNGKWSGYWSNAVQDLKSQPFFVKSKEGQVCHGLYEDIKGTSGVKFATGLYIAYKEADGTTHIGFLKLLGAAMSEWIDILKGKNMYVGAFAITGAVKKKKGKTTYQSPVIAYKSDISEASDNEAKELTAEVVEYLKAYFNNAEDMLKHGVQELPEEYSGLPEEAPFEVTAPPDDHIGYDDEIGF